MDIFEKHHNTYRFVMSIVGLWPFDESICRRIQRILLSALIFSCLATQIVTLLKFGSSMQQRVALCSTISPILLFFARYVSFVLILPTVRILFELIRKEESLLQDSNELQILVKSYKSSSRVIYLLLCSWVISFMSMSSLLFVPLTLDVILPLNESRTRNLNYFLINFVGERILYVDTVCLTCVVIIAVGLLSMVCTESALSVVAHYICGLFRITCYRIRNAIRNAIKLSPALDQVESNYADLRRAVDSHRRAIECANITVSEMTITYLIASFLVVVSFSLSLYRMYKAISLMDDLKELFLGCSLVFTHIVFMFVNNYSGQIVIDDSMKVFNEPYDSMWYFTPLEVQKMVLFIMLKSTVYCSFNLSGLFVPCYSGFSTMMSASFSYFTVMYSTQ